MRNALHEQLLKAGLVDEKRLEDAEREKRRERIPSPMNRPVNKPASRPENRLDNRSENRPENKQAKKDQREKHRAPPPSASAKTNRTESEAKKAEAQAGRRMLEREIVQVIKANRQKHNDGDEVYNFVDGKKIGRIYVTPDMHAQLTRGEFAIVRLRTRYAVVPTATAVGIAEKAPDYLVVAHQGVKPDSEDPAYAEHPIPDDLRW